MPKRIQRQRTKGWRMPEGVVYVGRPTKWGNPFGGSHMVYDDKINKYVPETLRAYREWIMSGIEGRFSETGHFWGAADAAAGYPERNKVIAALGELRGKDLTCWCPLSSPCHADVLLEVANAP